MADLTYPQRNINLVNYTPVYYSKDIEYPTLPNFNNFNQYLSDSSQSIQSKPIRFTGFTEQSDYSFTKPTQDIANLSFEDLVKKYNLPIQITSGYRDSKTKQGRKSNHSRKDKYGNPMAYDIQPFFNGRVDKSDSAFTRLRNILESNPEIREWFKVRNWGIIDETIPQMMAKTGATGKHFHIGPDNIATRFI